MKLTRAFYVTFVFVFGVLGLIARYSGISVWRLVACLHDEIVITVGAGDATARSG
jgi:aerobic C4-dicarboxylate transport protein